MIILTGDVHHMSMRTNDQKLLKGVTELKITEEYLRIANSHNIRPLLFLTGRLAVEEPKLLKKIIDNYKFDIGGHTYYGYSGFFRRYYYGIYKKIFKLANGSKEIQRKDILNTLEIYKKNFNIKINAWRNHAYRNDLNTYRLLSECGIRLVSNRVVSSSVGPTLITKQLWEIPINTTPDHEHLKHSKESTHKISINGWLDKVMKELLSQKKSQIDSVVLAHPACMFIEDEFSEFKELCNFIKNNGAATAESFCEKYI